MSAFRNREFLNSGARTSVLYLWTISHSQGNVYFTYHSHLLKSFLPLDLKPDGTYSSLVNPQEIIIYFHIDNMKQLLNPPLCSLLLCCKILDSEAIPLMVTSAVTLVRNHCSLRTCFSVRLLKTHLPCAALCHSDLMVLLLPSEDKSYLSRGGKSPSLGKSPQ